MREIGDKNNSKYGHFSHSSKWLDLMASTHPSTKKAKFWYLNQKIAKNQLYIT